MNKLKVKGALGIIAFILFFSGCTWQRIPTPPAYYVSKSLPIRIGIELGGTSESQVYGPLVVKHLKEMGVFDSVVYPYRDGDTVDGVIRLTIKGGWKGENAGVGFIKGAIIGLSLFTLSPIIGPEMTGIHDANVTLSKDISVVVEYSIHLETSVSWGLLANTTEVSVKSTDLQLRKISVEIANRIDKDRLRILKEFGKAK
ncbi:MAG: hypothetical protein HY096_02065 [Nitrospinae bacterium]|nr:hypothetical protein [Nitrospinota bacterium]MBI3815169.1 hypothetical protein [Nitrospinota bacterium]